MKKLILLLLIVPVVSFGQKYYVSAEGGLNVRVAPDLNSAKAGLLMYKQIVTIKSYTGKKLVINDTDKQTGITKEITGEWVEINGFDIRGYVFDGFLKKYEGNFNKKVSEFEIINLPGKYCLDGYRENWEVECLVIRVSLKSKKGEFYAALKEGGIGEPGYWIELLKRDDNKIFFSKGSFEYDEETIDDYKYFFENNFEITVQRNHIIISNFYNEGNSKRYNLEYQILQ